MKRMRKLSAVPAVLFSVALWASTAAAQTYTYTTLDDPLGVDGTRPYGISGSNIVGDYYDSSGCPHGFLYDGSTYTPLDGPSRAVNTYVNGVAGNTIVGYYSDSSNYCCGFIYSISNSTYTTLNGPPGATGTCVSGIDGSNLVGVYLDSSGLNHSFLYNLSTSAYTTINDPSANSALYQNTWAYGISGDSIVGSYYDSAPSLNGYLYSISAGTWAPLDDPSAFGGGTVARGVSGNDIVGYYQNEGGAYAFLYDGSTYTTLAPPGSTDAIAWGIDDSNIVGSYTDSSGIGHGFVASIVPEPSTFTLLGVAAVALSGCLCRHRRAK